jgi:hypothetical protein
LVFNKRALRTACKTGKTPLKKEQKNILAELWGIERHHPAKLMILN